ncbi:MAG: cytochrome c3 family protein [Verrucomicrobiales bacterium]
MGNFFPRWSNFLPLKLAFCFGVLGIAVAVGMTYYFTPKYTRVGYMPSQPVAFDHGIHAGQLGLDCRYCHSFVEDSPHSNVPTTQTCFNCHSQVQKENPKLAPVWESMSSGDPLEWVQIHQIPDYAYFDHSVHVARGVSCVKCHGQVNEMETVYHAEPHSMGWCLECHRAPEKSLRPGREVFNLDWKPGDEDRGTFYREVAKQTGRSYEDVLEDARARFGFTDLGDEMTQKEVGETLVEAWNVRPPESCSTCHR